MLILPMLDKAQKINFILRIFLLTELFITLILWEVWLKRDKKWHTAPKEY